MKKLSFEDVKLEFESRGFELLSDYSSSTSKLKASCPNGHVFETNWKTFRRTKKTAENCGKCRKLKKKSKKKPPGRSRKYSLEFIEDYLCREGYKLLTKELSPGERLIKIKCPVGHVSDIYFSNFYTHGNRCFYCKGSQKYTIDYVRSFFKEQGYTLLTSVYKGARQKLTTICPEGHTYEVSFSKFKDRGYRCSTCSGKGGFDFNKLQEEFDKVGYKVLTKSYKRAIDPVPFVCDKGHTHEMALNNLMNGQRCGKCFKEFECGRSSRAELSLRDYFENLQITFIHGDRDLIFPYEVDFYFPNYNLAIEYCGLYWHSEDIGKPRNYHYNKMDLCVSKSTRLITIFEDEYICRPDVVISRINSALGIVENRLYGRNCHVEVVNRSTAKDFLEENHLQGAGNFSIAFGLFYKNLLVGVITGGSLSRAHVGRGKIFELKRLAFLPNFSVVGGASKLFKYLIDFARGSSYTEIRSYCDMRWANPFNTVYEKLGFSLLTYTKYTPHYFKGQKRYRNQSLRKTPEERLTGKTEAQLRREQGYRIIWDCGHRTYVYYL